MPVPPFDRRGFLPPFVGADATTPDRSPYTATMSEVVAALGTSPSRRKLLAGLVRYRELLKSAGYNVGVQFIDGSFVENVEVREGRDPGDIDVFSFVVRPDSFRQDPALWAAVGFPIWVSYLMNRDRNKAQFGLDTFGIAVDQHPTLTLLSQTIYWYSLFSHKRVSFDWKGFLLVPLDHAADATAATALGNE